MTYALSTMWAVQPRFEGNLRAFMETARDLGYSAIEVNHSMTQPMVDQLLAATDVLPIASVHAPAPLERDATYGPNRDINLAATDDAERTTAVRYVKRSIDLAAECGARHVVVHLGHTDNRRNRPENRLWHLYNAGVRPDRPTEDYTAALDATRAERAALIAPHLEAARRTLDELVAYAHPRRVALGLESRLRYHQIPGPAEAADLLAPYPPDAAGYWHDVGHVEVQHRLGLVDRADWFPALAPCTIGAHLHDVRALADHRAPGTSDVDFRWLATHLPRTAARTLEINETEPPDAVARAIEVLRASGFP